jgi:hypothetical protein
LKSATFRVALGDPEISLVSSRTIPLTLREQERAVEHSHGSAAPARPALDQP